MGLGIAPTRSRLLSIGFALALSIVAGKMFLVTKVAEAGTAATNFKIENLDYARHIPWQDFSEERVAVLRAARKPGFIDFTADW